jgi:hypothetical protein
MEDLIIAKQTIDDIDAFYFIQIKFFNISGAIFA